MRLQKYIANAGLASRRMAEEMIASGRVAVNGVAITTTGTKVKPGQDIVAVDGKKIRLEEEFVYIMLHKPEGVVTTVSDPQSRRTVMDLVKELPWRVYPVGRLDYDSSGLIFLTNDGELAQRLTHPRYGAEKTYAAVLDGLPGPDAVKAFENGLNIGEGRLTSPAKMQIDIKNGIARITIREGRNRQIRKMCEAIGHPVIRLKRVSMGGVHLGSLARGQWRMLTPAEIKRLKGNGKM